MPSEATGPLGMMRAARADITGDERLLSFQCHSCTRVRRNTQRLVWAAFIAVLALAFVLQLLG
jgi:hypothetical protein